MDTQKCVVSKWVIGMAPVLSPLVHSCVMWETELWVTLPGCQPGTIFKGQCVGALDPLSTLWFSVPCCAGHFHLLGLQFLLQEEGGMNREVGFLALPVLYIFSLSVSHGSSL